MHIPIVKSCAWHDFINMHACTIKVGTLFSYVQKDYEIINDLSLSVSVVWCLCDDLGDHV